MHRQKLHRKPIAIIIVGLTLLGTQGFGQEEKRNVILIAGMKSHGPEGNGIHDYAWSARLIKTMLENSNVRDQVSVSTYLTGWPSDPRALSRADTIMVISDGRDGDSGREAPHLASSDRVRQVDALVAQGCGFITFHFSTFAPDSLGDKALDWYGGYFDWQTEGRREWYSKITTIKAVVSPASQGHPVLRGVSPFKIHEEFYHDLRFRRDDSGWTPIWNVADLPTSKPHGTTVAWAVERPNGSRGFGTTCGHFYRNWRDDGFRKTILNAVAWTAHVDVPGDGVSARFFSREEIARHLTHPDSIATSNRSEDDDAYVDEPYWYQPGHPVQPATARSIKTLPGFQVERVFAIPEEYGSWTAITSDDQGRLLCAAQHKSGIYRVTTSQDGKSKLRVERLKGVATQVGWSHGLLSAFGSLYVTVSEDNDTAPGGLYRLRDTNGDDQYDEIDHLFEVSESGEHGPHALVVSPDKRTLTMMFGNGTRLPDAIKRRRPSSTDGTDHLMPPGFESSEYTPGGFVLRFDPDGGNRQLICGGLRNSYDLAFNQQGDLFTFDSDMEWDLGAPWYRPTRICHLVSGAEFGWRGDAAKWPEYFEDSSAPVLNVGPGSPSGIVFGYGAKFPAKYQHALFACDWTFATIHAVHLEPHGASYRATIEEFVGANGLPVTDLTIGADGALYFLVGGRRLGSAIYRISYAGDEPTAPAPAAKVAPEVAALHADRHRLEQLHGFREDTAIDVAWPYLGHDDRAIHFAARTAIEAQPVENWRERVVRKSSGRQRLIGLLALARKDEPEQMLRLIGHINELDLKLLSDQEALILLRTYELALARGGEEIPEAEKANVGVRLRDYFPHTSARVNRELARLLCFLGDKGLIDRMLDQMAADLGERPALGSGYFVRNPKYGQAVRDILQAAPLVDRMHLAQMLLWIDDGWTKEQRTKYFQLIADAERNTQGGHWYGEFWNRIREISLDQTPKSWRAAMMTDEQRPLNQDDVVLPLPAGPGQEWTLSELLDAVQAGLRNRDFAHGKKMFAAAKCISCHRFQGEGSSTGPDLSSVGQRFTIRDVIVSTLEPSRAISDQYAVTMLTTHDGRTISGRIVSRNNQTLTIATNLNRPHQTQSVDLSVIDEEQLTPVSTMPDGLLDPLNREEVLDLLAYLISGGEASHPVFTD